MSVALLCGGHPALWDEFYGALDLKPEAVVCGVNTAGIFLPGMVHWFISQTWGVPTFVDMRARVRAERCESLHSPGSPFMPMQAEGHTFWPVPTLGTISMFAVRVLLTGLGFDKVVLAGVHLDNDAGYFYGSPREKFRAPEGARTVWEQGSDHLRNRVRSMGGWTEELLGRPDEDWLKEG